MIVLRREMKTLYTCKRVNKNQYFQLTVLDLILLVNFCCADIITSFNVNSTDIPKTEALHRLLRVFGMDHPGKRHRHHQPPQYMLELYNTIADDRGITRTFQPYKANVVRSFPEKDTRYQQQFLFDITARVPLHEKILEAEFHIYRTKENPGRLKEISPLIEVRIYQVMCENMNCMEENNRLLDIRKISIHSSGWEVFYVKQAVMDWLKYPGRNFGLLISVRNLLGEPTSFRLANFSRRRTNKKPILVVFTDDGRMKTRNSSGLKIDSTNDAAEMAKGALGELLLNNPLTENSNRNDEYNTRSRYERALLDSRKIINNSGCTRHELHVDFEKIGWSSWIISPKYYNAYFCKGKCQFPLGQNQLPTNHATVQSIVHELKLYPGLETPCCVPSKLYSINLLYFDEYENVILKQYDDMVAASCGCH